MEFKNSTQQGNLGEALVAAEFLKKGFEIYQNVGENNKFDLIVYRKDVGIKTVQVKSTNVFNKCNNGYKINLRTSHHYGDKNRDFDSTHLDFLVCVIMPENKFFYFNCDEFKSKAQVRFSRKRIDDNYYEEDLENILESKP